MCSYSVPKYDEGGHLLDDEQDVIEYPMKHHLNSEGEDICVCNIHEH